MSKQMACQLTAAQVAEWGKELLVLVEAHDGKYDNFGDLMDAEVPDAKRRARLGTALVVLQSLETDNMNLTDIQRVIRWRDENGKPGAIEIHYNKSGKEKRSVKLANDRGVLGLLTYDSLLQGAGNR